MDTKQNRFSTVLSVLSFIALTLLVFTGWLSAGSNSENATSSPEIASTNKTAFQGTPPIGSDYQTLHLPEGAIAQLGKGSIQEVAFSPDGSLLAVASDIGIWLYDTTTLWFLGNPLSFMRFPVACSRLVQVKASTR